MHFQITSVLLTVFAVSYVTSFATYRDAIPNGHRVPHPCDNSRIWFGVGHHSAQGRNERNAFGLDFKAAGYSWTRSLCMKDSDHDGQSNGQELGDPLCTWTRRNTPQETTNITHPGFQTPVADFPYNAADGATLNCAALLKKCKEFDEPGVRYIDLRLPNGSNQTHVPAKETTYMNWNFELPNDQEYHAVGFAPILDNLNVIHHFVVTSCVGAVPTDRGYERFGQLPGCEQTMYVWSSGLDAECLPMQAGVPFGRNKDRFVQLQLHWTNLQKRTDYIDTSGVRIYYTSKLRKYDTGMLLLGQQDLVIPPQKTSVISTSTCSAGCTKSLLEQGPIYLTAAFPHMHFLGKSMLVDHQSAATGHRTRIMDDKVYNYNSPAVYEYGPSFVRVEAGDTFHQSCEFNSMGRNTTTRWGFSSTEEMCYAFVRYFPKRGELFCNQYQTFDICNIASTTTGPRCSFFAYSENITQTVDRALTECNDVIEEVGRPTPSTSPVCSQMCMTQIDRVVQAHRSPCQQTRHKAEWKLLDKLIQGRISTLTNTLDHCKNNGLKLASGGENSGVSSLTTSTIAALVLPVMLTVLGS